MGSRDKSLQDKLKVFFKKGTSAPLPARNELAVTSELQRELGADTPLPRRLRAIKDIGEKAIQVRVQEGGVEKLWTCTRDLLDDSNTEARHAALGLLRCVAEGQADHLQIMRTIFFHYLRDTHSTHSPEDTQLRFKLLHTLTNSGKNINCFEEQIGPFLLEWLAQTRAPAQLVEFLQLVINVVKFNATYLDEHVVHGIVIAACGLCVWRAEGGVVAGGLDLLEAVVSYSLLPRAALPAAVAALCRAVNMEHYCQNSWKLMRYVVGADIGHAALQEMVEILRRGGSSDAEAASLSAGAPDDSDAGLVRGAVFYINMALWGPRRVPTLKVSFLAVLPAFLKALERNQPVVTYEVLVGVQSAVARAPQELSEPAWDVLLRILHAILQQDKSYDPPNELVHSRLHALITSIEQMADSGAYSGAPDALLDLVDCCGHDRPEASTMRLVTHRAAALSATGSEWVAAALALADKYLRNEPRLAVRLHTLQEIMAFIKRHKYVYGSELIELVGVPVLSGCALDAEASLRAATARALTELATGPAVDACTDLIDLLEKILNRPFEMYVTDVPIPAEADAADLALAAAGLLELLHDKLLASPAATPTRCFLVLLDHLDNHYKRPALFLNHPDIRLKIFEMLFGLRANAFNCVGFCYDSSGNPVHGAASLRLRPVCSPFLLAEPPSVRGQQPPPAAPLPLPPGSCVLPVGRAARILTTALTRESEWVVLSSVLRALPWLLQARALAVGRRAQDLDLLASTLCSMISDRSLSFPECLRVSGGQKLLASEFHAAALPALAGLAPYHSYLEPNTQQRIVRCLLKYGMVLRTPQPYIAALTLFTLETRDTMVRMLPEVLLDLSKISDTQAIAGPMLEFLSTLTRLPKVFASFVEDQYMSVFAILLPYTNPSRYNHYIVSLAHHVIAAWFLKCRLQYRRNFVRFIIHGLHNYIIMPFEEQLQYKSNFQQGSANEDSSNRQRSSSLGSRAVSRPPLGRGGGGAPAAFHVELTETCVDLLARYTSTPCNVRPRRSDTAQFLFSGGQAMTWLVGHKLVTITTSGCQQNSIKQGLCDRCSLLCKQHADSVASPLPPLAPPDACADTAASTNGDIQPEPAPSLVQVQVTDGESDAAAATLGPAPPQAPANPPEVKRYSKYSLQHSRSTDTSSSWSLSEPQLLLSSGHVSRQNSSENSKATDPLMEALHQFSQRFDRLSKEVDTEEAGWSRVAALAAAGACPCWCAGWAEVHVRSPTGDVCWLMRMQNQMNWDNLLESPLEDVAALLGPAPPAPPAPPSSASSGIGDSRQDVTTSDSPPRSRSGSAASPARAPLHDLYKSSSDSVVAGERRPPHAASHCIAPPQPLRMSTQPINIPGSPQRQSSSSTTDEDDMLLIVPEGKSRHPVRRSNSSPEMSSSWKVVLRRDEELPLDPEEMILLPSCEPTNTNQPAVAMHTKKPAKKADMRVSCEAIPEEISGTSPLAPLPHPHLMTFNSDPGKKADMRVSCEAIPEEISGTSPLAPLLHPHLMTFNSDPGKKADMRVSCEAIPEEISGTSPLTPLLHPHLMTFNSDPGKKADMRVSCEAIPEEISGTSPLAPLPHSHLMTFNSDPGAGPPRAAPPAAAAAPPDAAGAPAAPATTGAAPAQDTNRHHQLQKTASDGTVAEGRRPPAAPRAPAPAAGVAARDRDDLPPLARSKRSNTISVMSPTRRHRPQTNQPSTASTSGATSGAGGGCGGGGVTPSFVFLQLYHNMSTYPITPPVPGETQGILNPLAERPLRVSGEQHERTIKNLDLVPPVEIYKVGVLYVGPGQQDSEVAILRNECGSVRYAEFLSQLGTLVPLDGADSATSGLFLNLETGGKDGAYTYVWHTDIMQVSFHVATAMPTSASDPNCNEKRKYIGNDFVSIVYNDSGADFNIHTIKGQLNFCIVIVEPYAHGMNRVFMKTKDERIRGEFLAHLDSHCVTDANVALLARQMALHCALASQISQSLKLGGAAYASNSLERLRAIKRLRRRLDAERTAAAARAPAPYGPAPALLQRVAIDDFNDYT